jgi:hypothetical protein
MFRQSVHPCRTGPGLPLLLGLISLALVGCEVRPSAPSLTDAPVYQNNREGFRFLVPDNWTQRASAALPAGTLEGEVLLTQYSMKTAGAGAALEILCFESTQTDDLQAYHAGPSHGSQQWESLAPAESLDVNGTKAERFAYQARISDKDMIKEVVCFQRGSRVYNFIGLFWATDDKAREQMRRAVGSVIWRD